MTGTEAILIVLIIILTFMVLSNKSKMVAGGQRSGCAMPMKQWNCVNRNTGDVTSVKMMTHQPGCSCAACHNYDTMSKNALSENMEYFAACKDTSETSKALDCVCGDSEKFSFAEHDFGAPGMDYKSYVTSQAVDDKVIKNHLAYVEERKGLGPEGEFTGRTYSPDSNDSYDPIPWIGLRRPQYVSQCNPTTIPDVDTNLYKGNRPFCFWT